LVYKRGIVGVEMIIWGFIVPRCVGFMCGPKNKFHVNSQVRTASQSYNYKVLGLGRWQGYLTRHLSVRTTVWNEARNAASRKANEGAKNAI
jgi:hypothetical protein